MPRREIAGSYENCNTQATDSVPAGNQVRKPSFVWLLGANRLTDLNQGTTFGRLPGGCSKAAYQEDSKWLVRGSLGSILPLLDSQKKKRTRGEMQWFRWALVRKKKIWLSGSPQIISTGVAEFWLCYMHHDIYPAEFLSNFCNILHMLNFLTTLHNLAVTRCCFSFSWVKNVSDFSPIGGKSFVFEKGCSLNLWAPWIKSHIFNMQVFLMVYNHPQSGNNWLVFSKHLDNTFV